MRLMPLKQHGAPADPESLVGDLIQSIVISQKHEPKIAGIRKYDIINKVDVYWLQL